jgi:predicted ArsR family transcriptional regulator
MMQVINIRGEAGMQDTRQHILEILKERGQATVDEMVHELRKRRGDITAVTVRHHLARLQEESLITTPQIKHRNAPGRPQHIYTLTDAAQEYFPNNYQPLSIHLLEQLSSHLPPREVNVILEGVASRMAAEACIPDTPFPERLDNVVKYLNEHGYSAQWEPHPDGFVLRTSNCPYHHVSATSQTLCEMDLRLIASMLGVVPRLLDRISAGSESCSYLIPAPSVSG